MALVRRTMQRISTRLTRQVGIHFGETFPFWYICEYPKSGGTWLGRMIANYLDIPFAELSIFPNGLPCVNFAHWRYHSKLRRCFYIYRDGRDVMVSHYFFRMMEMRNPPDTASGRRWRRRYERAFGPNFDANDSRTWMARFVELEMTRPRWGQLTWPQHISDWYDLDRRHIAFLSYEQLLNEPIKTLKEALEKFIDSPVDLEQLEQTMHRYSFENMSGRQRGQEDRNSFLRKGIIGDWRHHFTKEAAEIFDHFAGQTLIDLGYEADRSWLTTHQFVS